MALTGLDIYKKLPKTNCKECGVPTCLAFAMKVAAGQAGLDQCPDIEDEHRESLDEASAPPQQLVKIGAGDRAIELGQETVLYRHEERFHHPTAVAISLDDDLDAAAVEARCREIAGLKFERMGAVMEVDMVAVRNASGQAEPFAAAAKVAAEISGKALALVSSNPANLRAAGEAVRDRRPLLWAVDAPSSLPEFVAVAKDLGLPLCLGAPGFDALTEAAEAACAEGLSELMLSPGPIEGREAQEFLTQSRRAAIEKKHRPLGYPIAMPAPRGDDSVQSLIETCWRVLKYAAITVIDATRPEDLLAILTTRQDIYTDPQKPAEVDPVLRAVGEPGPDAPLLVTTNFSLSYYSVESEVEASRVPAYILPIDTEGTSVLTAWAADKFTGEVIAAAVKESEIEDKVSHRKIIIPGYVAVLSASIKDESGWEVLVGPKEASGLVSYLKNKWTP
jgi:acetyl-CoA decarbonylase/synthase complex subunit gamma